MARSKRRPSVVGSIIVVVVAVLLAVLFGYNFVYGQVNQRWTVTESCVVERASFALESGPVVGDGSVVIHTKGCGSGNMGTLRHGDMSMGQAAKEVNRHRGERVEITYGKLTFPYKARYIYDIDIDFTQ